MKKKVKLFKYKFSDCEKEFPSSVTVKCTASKEEVKMYHKSLARLINKNYSNSWKLFEKTYIKKGNKGKSIKQLDEDEAYDTKPEKYRQFLIMNYLHYKDRKDIEPSVRGERMFFYNECYKKRWGSDIEEVINNV